MPNRPRRRKTANSLQKALPLSKPNDITIITITTTPDGIIFGLSDHGKVYRWLAQAPSGWVLHTY